MRRFTRRALTLLALLGLALAGPLPCARAVITTAGNVEPDPTTTPWDSSTVAYVGKDANGTLTVGGGSDLASSDACLGHEAGASGLATISGAGSTWTNSAAFLVGHAGAGMLAITNGGAVVNNGSDNSRVGNLPGSTGLVVVSGPGSTWTNGNRTQVGFGGNGVLSIDGGGTMTGGYCDIGCQTGSTGTVTLDGEGSSWNNLFVVQVGSAGSGILSISNGADVTMGDSVHTDQGGYIGDEPGSVGRATVAGAGSTWTKNDFLNVGDSGNGTFRITDGGYAWSRSGSIGAEAGSTGTAVVDGAGSSWTNSQNLWVGLHGRANMVVSHGGTVDGASSEIGVGQDSTGEVVVTGQGSTWLCRELIVGNSGAGAVTIADHATVDSGFTQIGYRSGSMGTVAVDGTGSNWVSGVVVGGGGNGTVTVTGGGSVVGGGIIARYSGSIGHVTVSGEGSRWTGVGVVGQEGDGSLAVDDHGTVTFSADGEIASAAGSTGNLSVTGEGSSYSGPGKLYVGRYGEGSLTVADGATVSNGGDGFIGDRAGVTGAATVSGKGSSWTNGGDLYIGVLGSGTLAIRDGAVVSNDTGKITSANTGLGSVIVDGAGSQWINRETVVVGGKGSGTLAISGGATVSSAGFVQIGSAKGYSARVTIDGPASNWTNEGDFLLDGEGYTSMAITDGGSLATSGIGAIISASSSPNKVNEIAVIGRGSAWTTGGELSVGYFFDDAHVLPGTLRVAGGATVAAANASVTRGSLLAIAVDGGSQLVVDNGGGTLANGGTIRFLAGASPGGGATYTPVAAAAWTGAGVVQCVGGTWNSATGAFTASEVAPGASGEPVVIDLADVQRVLVVDPGTGWKVGASFQAMLPPDAAGDAAMVPNPTVLSLTATAIAGDALENLENLLEPGKFVLGAWNIAAAGAFRSGDPAYLSWAVGESVGRKDLTLWRYNGVRWDPYVASDLTCNGGFASFTAPGLGGFALSAVPEPTTWGLLTGAGLCLLVLRRRR